ncbi:AfsR/SARP family transcriptional regulator [Catellatospora tritici]|uniref:AfsR/SARP family transcriptional regulator n=1 Tax=Catellatospora tritici TaxID=2851566 RepID=UPI001C2DDD7E|nr:BTAD domain-containing putative transcriptional regulator [Catellatospora tritici]MBV1856673.1 tetratricopeptide repeat protein [Catellatospora tritici]
MEFAVLGPLTVHRDHQPVALNAAMQRALLALLLQRPGRPVSVACMVDTLWPDAPPATARKTIQVYIGRLRKALGDEDRIRHGSDGYTIVVAPDELDVTRFQTLVDAGRDARRRGALAEADHVLTESLRLWRGTPFADLDTSRGIADEARRLQEQWLGAQELRSAVRLDLRRDAEVIADLAGLLAAHPYQERLVAYLMLALYRSDRQSDALDLYRRTRDQLAEQLGIEPGHTMSWLQQAILRCDPRLRHLHTTDLEGIDGSPAAAAARPSRGTPSPATAELRPAQLPPDVLGFTGRSNELASLDAMLDAATEQPTAVVISAVSGTAGVGKTALAVHWAHRVRHRFPDGQLYVNLRGFDPTGTVMAPADAIRRFLDALAVASHRIPADPAAQADLLRTLLAGKRMLIVLDNARDPDQVRPLLPGATGCVVLITSRNRLTSLVAAEGAYAVPLDLLTVDEARQLLVRRIGPARIAAEPDAADELITRCAGLPLALAIVAATAATRRHLALAALADQLRDSRDRLDALSTRDTPATDVRAVFSWSYQALSPDAARLFRLLSLHPGPDCSTAAAASLVAGPADQVRALLDELLCVNLVNEHVHGRYHLHDLLRVYAAEVCQTTDTDAERRSATSRTIDHYLHTAHTAARLLGPTRDVPGITEPDPGVVPENPGTHEHALAWFTAEHRVLLTAIEHATARLDPRTAPLAGTLYAFLNRHGHWYDLATASHAVVAAAQRSGDLAGQAPAHRVLARAYIRLGRYDEAHTQLRHALDVTGRSGDRGEQAYAHHALAHLREQQGRHDDALDEAQQALVLFQATADRQGQAFALNAVGWYHTLLGDHRQALASCQHALAIFQELDEPTGQAATWDSLGYAHRHLGDHAQAVACYQHAIDLYRDLGDRFNQADTLTNLGDAHHAANHRGAVAAWRQALAIFEQLNHPAADQVRAKLDDLTISRP